MGLRKQKREIARARFKVLGINPNKVMGKENSNGDKNWRIVLKDDTALRKQIAYSMKSKRKIKKVSEESA